MCSIRSRLHEGAATRVAPSAMTGLGRERLSPWRLQRVRRVARHVCAYAFACVVVVPENTMTYSPSDVASGRASLDLDVRAGRPPRSGGPRTVL